MKTKINIDKVIEAISRSHSTCENPGFCLACGAEVDGVEPDARNYECEECGENKVFGAEEILLM